MSTEAQRYLSDADSLSLTPEERATVRLALVAQMTLRLTPEEKTDIRRAVQHAVYADPAPASMWSWLRMPVRLPATAFSILLLLGLSGGTLAYAAEGAVPGDTLYGVKIYVNESIRDSLQWSPSQRASWAVTKLQRRMDELHRLQARGVADTEIDVAIADHVEKAAHAVEFEVQALPAAAAERAAMRTAVNAAIGTDQDALRRASKINRVLKALKERADTFDTPTNEVIAPVPSANARARNEVQVKVEEPLTIQPRPTEETDVEVDETAETHIEVDVPTVEVPNAL